MKPSARADYGLRALLELALRYGQGVVQSAEIAARQGLPVAYLDQIMALLRRAGLIVSVRGPQGGHVLALPPAQVTMMQAMTVLEGPASPASSSEPEATGDPAAVEQAIALVKPGGRITLIGIPFGLQHFKLAKLAILPFGAKFVSH